MKKALLLIVVMGLVLTGVASADMPTLQLNGKFSKKSPYRDDYPYTKVVFAKNSMHIGILRRVAADASEFEELKKRIAAHDYKAVQAEYSSKYSKQVTREYDLTDAEKEVVRQHPREFPESYAKTGKRLMTAEILAWAGKELPRQGCAYIGEADLDGNGNKALVLRYFPPVTYRVYPTLRIFDAAGEVVLDHHFMELDFEGIAIADTDGDKRDEILMHVAGKNEIWVVGVAKEGDKVRSLPRGNAPPERPLQLPESLRAPAPAPTPTTPGAAAPGGN